MVLAVTNKPDFDSLLKNDRLVAVLFTAAWATPAQKIAPVFAQLAEKFTAIKFITVDVDENSETSEALGVSAMPTFKFFAQGVESVEELVGAKQDELEEKLAALSEKR